MPSINPDMREDIESWDLRVERKWPHAGWPIHMVAEPVPPVVVHIGVSFTNEASALEFEQQVRELLTGSASP